MPEPFDPISVAHDWRDVNDSPALYQLETSRRVDGPKHAQGLEREILTAIEAIEANRSEIPDADGRIDNLDSLLSWIESSLAEGKSPENSDPATGEPDAKLGTV